MYVTMENPYTGKTRPNFINIVFIFPREREGESCFVW